MADFAQMIGQSALENTKAQPLDLAGNMIKGASLALEKEKIQQTQQATSAKLAELEMTKFMKVGDWYKTASKMPEGPTKQAFVKDYIPKGIEAFGLGDKFHPTSQKMMQGNPMLAAYLQHEMEEGRLDMPGLLHKIGSPDELAKMLPDAVKYGNLQELQTAAAGEVGKLAKVQSKFTAEGRKDARTQTAADATAGRQTRTLDREEERRFQSNVFKIQDRANKRFKDLNAIKQGIRTSDALLQELETKIANGEKILPAERAKLGVSIEPIVRGIGQAKGPLSDADVQRILGRYGVQGKFQELYEKWITGEVNPDQVKAFREIIKTGAEKLDQETQRQARILKKEYSNLPGIRDRIDEVEAVIPMDEYTQSTLGQNKKKDPKNFDFDSLVVTPETTAIVKNLPPLEQEKLATRLGVSLQQLKAKYKIKE